MWYSTFIVICLVFLLANVNCADLNAFFTKMKADITTDTGPIKKTHFNDTKRMVFVAGLEGTGHHAWKAMFDVCMNNKVCHPETVATSNMMYVEKFVKGLFSAANTDKSVEYLTYIITSWTNMATKFADGLYVLGMYTKTSGMFSYPNGHGTQKVMQHPDLFLMAYLAEAAGVDFRVIVLQRSAKQLIASNKRRGFSDIEEKILIDNSAVLYTQLQMIDPAFYYCVQYESLANMTTVQKDALIDFIHPTALKQPLFDRMLTKVYPSNSTSTTVNTTSTSSSSTIATVVKSNVTLNAVSLAYTLMSNDEYCVFQLQKRLNFIHSMCTARATV